MMVNVKMRVLKRKFIKKKMYCHNDVYNNMYNTTEGAKRIHNIIILIPMEVILLFSLSISKIILLYFITFHILHKFY